MSVTEFLVRDCTLQVNQGTTESPDWLDIDAHLVDFNGSGVVNNADTTTFEDEGWTSQLVASRGMTFELNGKSQEDPDDGSRDPGQLYCESWANAIGTDSRKGFRILLPSGAVFREFIATANMSTPIGGGSDDASNWGLALTSSGVVSGDDLPALLAAPTAADATTGNDLLTGTWTAPAGTVTAYEVRTFRDSDDVVVDRRRVAGAEGFTTPPTAVIVNGLAPVAHYFDVRAQNAAGWGPWSAVSDTVTVT